jgi:hypothetical protein
MPQKWEKYWPLSAQDEAGRIAKGQVRDIIKHTIGNLTLLTDVMNAVLSMGPWDKKRDEILKHSKLNLNRDFQNTLQWDEKRIRIRGESLALLAVKIWAHTSTVPTS